MAETTIEKKFKGVCASIIADRVSEAQNMLKAAADARADFAELRLDALKDFKAEEDLAALLQSSTLPCIVTYRPEWEGGNYHGDEAHRLETLKRAMDLGAEYVDVELKAVKQFLSDVATDAKQKTNLIISHHDFEQTPPLSELERLMDEIRANGADIAKIATTVNDISENRRLFQVLERSDEPTIVLGMGGRGIMTRILAPKYGGYLTFASLEKGMESAPGQLTIDELKNIYHLDTIDKDTKVFGVIGNPVFHSKGPIFFNPCMQKTNYNGVYLHHLVDNFEKFIEAFRDDPSFAGYSITVPHKEEALRLASSVEETTKKIGATNTYVRGPDGSFAASNTDWWAAIGTIEEQYDEPIAGKTIVLVGAGGVSKGIAFGGSDRGCKILVANRTYEKAVALADKIPNCEAVSLEDVQNGVIKGDILANGTSLGMAPKAVDETPVPQSCLKNYEVVFDAVYTPKDTRLLREAKEVGCKIATGHDMFFGQAAVQFERFTGLKAPKDNQ